MKAEENCKRAFPYVTSGYGPPPGSHAATFGEPGVPGRDGGQKRRKALGFVAVFVVILAGVVFYLMRTAALVKMTVLPLSTDGTRWQNISFGSS